MTPYTSETLSKEEIMSKAAKDLSIILNDCFDIEVYELILNPDRKWWQFWKDKYVTKEI